MNDTLVSTPKYAKLKELSNQRVRLKKDEKDFYDYESPKKYLESHKERKRIEKEIFKLIKSL